MIDTYDTRLRSLEHSMRLAIDLPTLLRLRSSVARIRFTMNVR